MGVATTIAAVLMLAVVCEYLTNIFKPIIPKTEYPIALIISMAVGIVLTLLTKLDLLSALGFEVTLPVAGQVVTGFIISGGSSVVHELVAKLRSTRIGE